MSDPVQITLVARGVAEVQASFRSVEQTIVGFERSIASTTERGSRARITQTQREGSDREKAFAKLSKEAEKWERQGVTAAEKAAKERTKASERAEADQVRAVEKAEQQKQRAADQTAAHLERVRNRSAEMAGRDAAREADKRIAEEKRAYAARVSFARNLGGKITGSISGAMHDIVGVGRGLTSSALQIGGGFSVADSVQRELKLTGAAASIASSSQADTNPDGSTGKKWKTSEILRSARNTANALSMDPEEVLKGIGKYKDLTGNLGEAVQMAPQMAKLATALGADTGELMENAGNARNAGLKGDDIMRMARVQTMQGMQGAVELKDMAKYGARLTAGAGLYGGDRSTNIATMGAFAQIARQHGGAASAAEATLAAQRFTTDIQKHSKSIEAQGIKVGDGHGGLRDGREIIKDMLTKTGGDVTKFGAMGLGERGVRVLTGVSDIYRQASGGTRQKGESDAAFHGRQAAGMAAVDAELGKYTKGVSDSDIDKASKERLGEADKQVTKAMNELRDAVGTQLLPEFIKLVPVLTRLMPTIQSVLTHLTKFAEWFANNPIKGIGAVVLAKVTADLGKAAIGEGVKQILMRLLAGGAPGGVPGGGGGGGGAALIPAVGIGLAAGAAVAAVIKKSGEGYAGGEMAAQDLTARVKSWNAGNHRTGVSPQEAGKIRSAAEARLQAHGGTFEQTGNLLTSPFDDSSSKKYDAFKGDQGLVASAELIAAIKANTTATTAQTHGPSFGLAGTAASANSPTTTLPLSARP